MSLKPLFHNAKHLKFNLTFSFIEGLDMVFLYFIFMVAAAIFYPMFKDDLSFILLLCLTIFPEVMLVLLLIARRKIKVEIVVPNRLSSRENGFAFRMTVENKSVIPISCCGVKVAYRMRGSEKYSVYNMSFPIRSRRSESVAVSFKTEHSGILEYKIKKLRIYDYIGLTSVGLKCADSEGALILPVDYDYSAADGRSAFEDDLGEYYLQKNGCGDDVIGLREYRDGDRMNKIHWKLSSRCNTLIVKELDENVSRRIMIIPDIESCKNADERDAVYDTALSLCELAKRMDNPPIIYAGEALEGDNSAVWLKKLYEQSDTATFSQGFVTDDNLRGTAYSHIIIISPSEKNSAVKSVQSFIKASKISLLCTGEKNDCLFQTDAEIFYTDGKTLPEGFSV